MAGVDRYRSVREGYQPPTLPPKPVLSARPSNSPSSRRDVQVPPAVPTPPPHSSRTSSLPPQSRPGAAAPSPAHPSPTSAPRPRANQWYFTQEETLSSPSILDGLTPRDERLRRAKGVNFIYQAGAMIELPQTTLWVAAVFFHRFYMRVSMDAEKSGIHHYNIAATALFLANKTEENCRKTKDLIYAVVKVAQKNPRLVVDEQSKEYWKWRDSILMHEEVMLEQLTFDLMVDNPYQRLYECLDQIGMLQNKTLRDSAWAYCCDSPLTVVPLLMNAREVAISALYFAAVSLGEKIEDDAHGEPWWRVLKSDESLIQASISVVMDFYTENPMRKSDARYQGSPVFSLENTRRTRDVPSQTEAGSSHNGTPMGTDRGGTQSPRARHNTQGQSEGLRGGDGMEIKRESEGNGTEIKRESGGDENGGSPPDAMDIDISTATKGDSDALLKVAANDLDHHDGKTNGVASSSNGLISPGLKRKSAEPEVDDIADREQKRARLSDEDEGEVLDA